MWTVPHPGLQLYGPDRVWTVRAYSFRCRPCREKWTGWKCGTFRISVVCRSGASCVYNFIASIGPIPDIHPSSKTLWPIDMKLCASYTVGELRVLWLVIVGPLEDMFLRLTGLTWFEALALASVWCSTAYWDCRLFLYRPTFASSLKAVIRLIQLPLRWQLAGDVACVWNCWHSVSRCPRAAESRVSWIGTWHAVEWWYRSKSTWTFSVISISTVYSYIISLLTSRRPPTQYAHRCWWSLRAAGTNLWY